MLGCVEFCVPGGSLEEKLDLLEAHNLWLEMICTGERNIELLNSFNVEVKSVQAYLLHDLSLLSKDRGIRRAAIDHVKQSIVLARKTGAKYVVSVPTYRAELISNPFKECVRTFKELLDFASDYEVNILIESLSPKRTSFLPSLQQVDRLVRAVNRENTGLLADTCHIFDSNQDVVETLSEFQERLTEIHLKDSDSKPPGKGSLDFDKILEVCRGSMLCIEYSSPALERDFEDSLKYLNQRLSALE
jgi:sugar phosphate isomerase/epimerase